MDAINSSGSAVGTASGSSGSRALRFNPDGTHVVLSVPAGFTSTVGQAISDSGTVYGVATDVTRRQIPVSWSPAGVVTTLALPAGATWADLKNASANGYVAGYVTGPGIATTAVRWNPDGSVTVLNGLAVDATTMTTAVNQLGAYMAADLTAQGKQGVVINGVYDAYTPSRAYMHYKGGARILSETASADLATPVSDDYGPTGNEFSGTIAWVQIDLGDDALDHDTLITPEERLRIAMARQ